MSEIITMPQEWLDYLKWANHFHQGHVMDVLRQIPEGLVDMVFTSPPYWGLRDYGLPPTIWGGDPNCKHQWDAYIRPSNCWSIPNKNIKSNAVNSQVRHIKAQKLHFCSKCGAWRGSLGLEPDFHLYIQHLKTVFAEVKRVLKPTGTCWVNIADTYSQSGGAGNQYDKFMGKNKIEGFKKYGGHKAESLPAKCMCGVPERFKLMMTDELGWVHRNTIIWYKPNCMPSSAKDRFTVDYEYIYLFSKEPKYYWEPQFDPLQTKYEIYNGKGIKDYEGANVQNPSDVKRRVLESIKKRLGRNKRCVWRIPTKPYPEAHFATFPPKLLLTPIKAGCPALICKKCGQPRQKIIRAEGGTIGKTWHDHKHDLTEGTSQYHNFKFDDGYKRTVQGYTDCGCNAGWRPGVVLDPFMGSGATAKAAQKLGRDFIGIELSPKYIKLAEKRVDRTQKKLLELLS